MNNAAFCDVGPLDLLKTDVSEERVVSILRAVTGLRGSTSRNPDVGYIYLFLSALFISLHSQFICILSFLFCLLGLLFASIIRIIT
jgi:hypothetical protein